MVSTESGTVVVVKEGRQEPRLQLQPLERHRNGQKLQSVGSTLRKVGNCNQTRKSNSVYH